MNLKIKHTDGTVLKSYPIMTEKKNPNNKHIQIGDGFLEITNNEALTTGFPKISLLKDDEKLYIKEKFSLMLEINNTAPIIDLTECLKSWSKITFNGQVVESIPINIAGIIEIENAVALDIYEQGSTTDFGRATRYSLTSFSGDIYSKNTTKTYRMFNSCSFLTDIDLSNFDSSKVTDMFGMFHSCTSLTNINLCNFDATEATEMSLMFSGCNSLASIDLSGPHVTLDTVNKVSNAIVDSELSQTITIYVSDSSKHQGLNYPNIVYAYN